MSSNPGIDPDRVAIDRDGDVAHVRLTRAGKHNGLDLAMFESIDAAIDELSADEDLRAVVLSGDGPSFCAGLDVSSFVGGSEVSVGGDDPDDDGLFARRPGSDANIAQRVAWGWRVMPVPVIAALHGVCYGGGFQIALGPDIRIAAPGTRMSVMEMRYGLIPDMSLSRTLPRLTRDDVARELTYSGRVVEADEALSLGLITRIADDPIAAAQELAVEIATKSPDAIRSAKRLWNAAWVSDDVASLALEEELQRVLIGNLRKMAAAASSG